MSRTRSALTAFLLLHGFAHSVGVAGNWELTGSEEEFSTRIIGGLDMSTDAMRMLGVLWLLAGVGFVAAAWGLARSAPWRRRGLAVAAGFSALLCVIQVSAAWIGLLVNCAILVGLLLLRRRDAGTTGRLGVSR